MAGYIGNRAVALSTTAANVTGTVTAGALDISGDTDIDGTTNLDAVDIDGAVDMASTLAVGGVVTANAGVVVDNITIDGAEIDLSSGDLTVDVAGNISLDADDGGHVRFKDGGTQYASIFTLGSGAIIDTPSGGDITLDSAAEIILDADSGAWRFKDNGTSRLELSIGSGNSPTFYSPTVDSDIVFRGNDNGSAITSLTLDMSNAGAATFNDAVGVILELTTRVEKLETLVRLQTMENQNDNEQTEKYKSKKSNWKYFLLIVLIIFFSYFFYFNKIDVTAMNEIFNELYLILNKS